MNPSSTGWINKFIKEFPKELIIDNYASPSIFYKSLKKTGFIYGVSVRVVFDEPISHLELTTDEYTKINLFHSLLHTYFIKKPKSNYDEAIKEIITFYKAIGKGKRRFFQKLNISTSPSESLEKILAARLQESNSILKKDTASLLTYSLLYLDSLAFAHYLTTPKTLKVYLDTLEKSIIEHSISALDSKENKNKYDRLVIEMVQSSADFLVQENHHSKPHGFHTSSATSLEKEFIFDICCLAVWDDRKLDVNELMFLQALAKDLSIKTPTVMECIEKLEVFSLENATSIKLFQYAHPVKQFYKQSSEMVNLLILRNKQRLTKELNESGELLVLLSQSTLRDLSKEEKTKVKDQLLDIFKSIPSLTIFMLPGGAILLPLFVKLIPKLLPSAFQENRVEEDDKSSD